LRALRETGETLDAFTADLETYPQVMINVPVAKGCQSWNTAPTSVRSVAEAEAALNGSGRGRPARVRHRTADPP